MGFVHLHNHSEYSKLDGLARVNRIPFRAKEMGQNAVSITDHGGLRGNFAFQQAALKAGIKAIHGEEFYLAFGSRFEKNSVSIPNDDETLSDADGDKDKQKYYMHLTVLARTKTGFQNLVKIHNATYDIREDGAKAEWFKPRMDFDLLKEHGEGLIVLTGCLGGPVAGPLARAAHLEEMVASFPEVTEVIDELTGRTGLTDEEKQRLRWAEKLMGKRSDEDLLLEEAAKERKSARDNLNTMIEAVGRENVYIEIMYHHIGAERRAMMELIALSEETGIPMVATNDCHYEREHEHDHHDGFLAVGVGRGLDDPDRFRFNGSSTYFMRSEQEMIDVLGNHPDDRVAKAWRAAVQMSQTIADRCEEQTLVIPEKGEYHLPKFPLPEGFETAERYLHHLVGIGARRRYGDDFPTERQDVVDRLTEELRVINVMGFPDYFLIVQDLVSWARSDYSPQDWIASNGGTVELDYERVPKKPILVGPGRGSAAGAAVSYVLGIVDICPLRYHLLFERFLEEGRAGMPDIDLDFERDRRQEVFHYIVQRWGMENVAHIGSNNFGLTKASIKDAARILKPSHDAEAAAEISALRQQGNYAQAERLRAATDKSLNERATALQILGNKLSNLVPVGYNFAKLANESDPAGEKFRELVSDSGQDAQDILELAKSFEGIAKAESIHPCGFIIAPIELDGLVPMRVDSENPTGPRIITWNDKACESMGLLKMDILGIQNLDIISKAFDNIRSNKNLEISMSDIPDPDDLSNEMVRNAYQLLSRGDTSGIFQSESGGMRAVYRDVQPQNLDDLSAVIALFRPGPLAAGVPALYAERKHGRQQVNYDQFTRDPEEARWLDSVLSTTFGLFTYQEQLMRLGTVIAGFDAAQRSVLRRAVGKKDPKEMAKVGLMLEAGAEQEFFDADGNLISPSFTKETAARFFEQAQGSAEYLFNASHSAAYAQLAFVTAYLKANWPVEYGAAILATSDKQEKKISALQDLRAAGIEVQAPNVNLSSTDTSAVGEVVVIGFKEIKNVGSAGKYIFAEREANGPFTSIGDLMTRVTTIDPKKNTASKISTSVAQALIESGALDEFGPRLGQLAIMRAAAEAPDTEPLDAEWTVLEQSARQRALIGVAVGEHPILHHVEFLKQWQTNVRDHEGAKVGTKMTPLGVAVQIASETEDRFYTPVTGGIVSSWEEKAYSGGRRAIMSLESPTTTVESLIWDNGLTALMKGNRVPKIGDLVAVQGSMKIKTVTMGDEDDPSAETVSVPSLNLKEMWKIEDPEETRWELPDPGHDVHELFAAAQTVDLAARRKAEKEAAKVNRKDTAKVSTVTTPKPVLEPAPEQPRASMEAISADPDPEPEPELSLEPEPTVQTSSEWEIGWRQRKSQSLLTELKVNGPGLPKQSVAATNIEFVPGRVRFATLSGVTRVYFDEVKLDSTAETPALRRKEATEAARRMLAMVLNLETLQGEPCEEKAMAGWNYFDLPPFVRPEERNKR